LTYITITISRINVRQEEEVDCCIGLIVEVKVGLWNMVLSNGRGHMVERKDEGTEVIDFA
jgi:hypothetical protein